MLPSQRVEIAGANKSASPAASARDTRARCEPVISAATRAEDKGLRLLGSRCTGPDCAADRLLSPHIHTSLPCVENALFCPPSERIQHGSGRVCGNLCLRGR